MITGKPMDYDAAIDISYCRDPLCEGPVLVQRKLFGVVLLPDMFDKSVCGREIDSSDSQS